MAKGTGSPRRSAVASGVATGVGTAVASLAAAVAGVLLAQKFGRDAETDGFLAAYAVYLVLVIGAQAFRMVVVPDLTRAAAAGRLADATLGYSFAVLAVAVPASALAIAFSEQLGDAVTGSLPGDAVSIAGRALVWLVPAAFAQLLAALAAGALAARDSYGVAAFAYAAGGVAGLALFVALADGHGLVALAWGVALNGALTLAIPLAALAGRGDLRGRTPFGLEAFRRLGRVAQGAAVPIALQGIYLIALRLAADLGVGRVTSLSYAYLIGALLVAATASSLSLVSSAPLTRRGLDAESAAAHVVHSSWLSLPLIAAGAGVFALAGGPVVTAALGEAYTGGAGRELGRLVVYLAPWMLASVAISVTFPLPFVMGGARALVPIALGALAVHVPLAWGLRELWGLPGLALALGVSTLAALAATMASLSPRMLALSALGLGRLALVAAALAALAFGVPAALTGGIPAALAGLAAFVLLLAALRPRGLREAWAYVRALH